MKNQVFRERECIHRDKSAEGEFYNGSFYVKALQRLPVDRAMQVAKRVDSFFWADAEHMLVWLCAECADDLSLSDSPRSIAQVAQRRA
jgi:hypothetical protein